MGSYRDQYAQDILRRCHDPTLGESPWIGSPDRSVSALNIGIVGGGVAGLYAALILESLMHDGVVVPPSSDRDFKPYMPQRRVKLTYTIYESNPDRYGGRLYTYNFSDSENDYFDVGAMRFPKIPWMGRVFHLLKMLKITEENKLLIPYILSRLDNLQYYNGKRLTNAQVEAEIQAQNMDPFSTGVGPSDSIDNMVNKALMPFREALKQDFTDGWKLLMKYDELSTREYMRFIFPRYTDPVINYLETFGSASNLYDSALAESVMDSLDFDYEENVQWYCIQGGAQLIAQRIFEKLQHKRLLRGQRVTCIRPLLLSHTIDPRDHDFPPTAPPGTGVTPDITADYTSYSESDTLRRGPPIIKLPPVKFPHPKVAISVDGERIPLLYDHVISTIPLSCLRMVDTSACHLSWNFQTAMRVLHYDCSVKVGIKFQRRWWEELGQRGGVSSTDRPTRTVVYPSYGIGRSDATIIVSYTWAQDAMRLGPYAQTGANLPPPNASPKSKDEQAMLDVILKDLTDIHDIQDPDFLRDLYVDHRIYSWYNSPDSAGAFALFGPGQFSNLYPEVTKPVGGVLHFAGEATSVHHAWVVGALDSAYRTVLEILHAEGLTEYIRRLKEIWGTVDEIDETQMKYQIGRGQLMLMQEHGHAA